jgi:hypothetical protein
MEVHNIHECDMDRFIRECVHLFHDRRSKDNLSFLFLHSIFQPHINIAFQHALTFVVEKKLHWQVMLVLDLPLLLYLTICMQVTLEGPWVK